MDTTPNDIIVKVCCETYTEEDIETSKKLVHGLCSPPDRYKKRRGADRCSSNMLDILEVLHSTPPTEVPMFASVKLHLPAVDLTNFDVSLCLQEVRMVRQEMAVIREASQDNFRLRSEFTKAMEDNARSVENMESELASLRAEVQQLRDIKFDHMKDVPISQECRSYATVLSQDKSAPPPTPRLTGKQRQLTVAPTTTLASSPARPSVTDGNSGFTQVRRRRRGKAIVGRASNKGSLVVAKPRPVEVFVSRLSVETSAESLTQFLHDNEMELVDCEKLVTRFGSYASFKLVIGKADSEKILSPDFWPSGILVRKFYQRSAPRDH
ncbi:uncharacterized protein [Branchiostoma lanceolatum]|uniref:uncharacterized protein n=1 Tax=Branchiostoma lanceolatum TaxID=7740 RepID=UPI0034555777